MYLPRNSNIPLTALRHLWILDDESGVSVLANVFGDVGLVDFEFGDGCIRVHDLLQDLCKHDWICSFEENIKAELAASEIIEEEDEELSDQRG